ncbi:unnamed protein product [Prunus armeniaca]
MALIGVHPRQMQPARAAFTKGNAVLSLIMYMPTVLSNLSQITTCGGKRLKVPPNNSSSSHLLLFIAPVFGLPSPPPATPSDDMDIKRTSTLSSTTLTSQPLPTVFWITEKSKKLAGFYPKSPLLVRAIPSTIFFDPGMIFQPLELFLLLVVLVRRNF